MPGLAALDVNPAAAPVQGIVPARAPRTRRAPPAAPGPRRGGPVALADLLPAAVGAALASRGAALGQIALAWDEIAGPRLAEVSEPAALSFPRGGAAGVLTLRVEGAFALEVQFAAARLLERVAGVLGHGLVGRIVVRQGAVGRARAAIRAPEPRRPEPAPVPTATLSPLDAALARLAAAFAAPQSRAH